MDSIRNRRSIRKYTNQKVEKEKILKILEAGMYAPSAGNEQPWEFIVINDNSRLVDLSHVSPYAGMLKTASSAIVVCGNLEREVFSGYWVQDCSAATQNILLEIDYLGLGAVWLGIYPIQERINYIKDFFNLPEYIIPFAIISLGYPAEQTNSKINRFDEKRIHWEVF